MVIECCTKNDSINNRICDRISPSIVNSFLNIILCVELVLGVLYRTDLSVWGSRYILWGLFGGYCLVALYRILSRLELYSKSFWAITTMLIGIGIVDYFSTGRNMFLKMTVLMLAVGGGREVEEYLRTIKWILLTLVCVTVVIIIASLTVGYGSLYHTDWRSFRGMGGIRFSLGFHDSLILQSMVMHITTLYCLVRGYRMRTVEYIVLFSLGCLFFVLTDSLTSSILVVLCLVLSMIIRVCDEQRNLIANILAIGNLLWLFIAVGMSLLIASKVINSGNSVVLDSILSGRINQLTVKLSGDNLLPYMENWSAFSNRMCQAGYDLGYIELFYTYGIVPGIIYITLMIYGVYEMWKKSAVMELTAMMIFSMYLFMEGCYWGNYVSMNFQFILVATAIGSCRMNKSVIESEDNTNKRLLIAMCVVMLLLSALVFGTKIYMNSTFVPV